MKNSNVLELIILLLVFLPVAAFSSHNISVGASESNPQSNQVFEVRYILDTPSDSLDTPKSNDFLITELIYSRIKILSTRDTVSEVRCLVIPNKSGLAEFPEVSFNVKGKKIISKPTQIQVGQKILSVRDSAYAYRELHYPDKLIMWSIRHAKDTNFENEFSLTSEFDKKEILPGEVFEFGFTTNDLDAIFEPPNISNFVLLAAPLQMYYKKVPKPFKTIAYKIMGNSESITILRLTAYLSNGVVMESPECLLIISR
jgi:BatD DUF11 like domain